MRSLGWIVILLLSVLLTGCPGDDDTTSPFCLQQEGCAEVNPLTTGLQTIESEGRNRQFYVQLPENYNPDADPKPLVFAFHGTSGSFELWRDGFYDLAEVVGNDAILVYPQATVNVSGVTQWDLSFDLQYFEDVLRRLRRGLVFDQNRIFVTGHSNGGGMAHDLGCNYGDVIRAIAPHAAILKSFICTGSVAALMTHGENDTLVRPGTGEIGHDFWVAYNGFDGNMTIPGVHPTCIDHSLGASPYPVQWCLHAEGMGEDAHNAASFAFAATWEFFSNLPEVEPTADPPAGGGNQANQPDTVASFTVEFPQGIGTVTQGSLSIYPAGTQQPVGGGPESILQLSFDPGAAGPGAVVSYEIPIRWGNQIFPGTYAFNVTMYVADGGNPIPLSGKDMLVFHDISPVDANTPVVVTDTLLMELVL